MAVNDFHQVFQSLRSYDFGQPPDALFQIEALIRAGAAVSEEPALRQEIVALLQSQAPFGAKQFACKVLWMLGSEQSVAVLRPLLAHPDIHVVEAACYAISRSPGPDASTALRNALGTAQGAVAVPIINLLGDRRDDAAVPALKRMCADHDANVAGSAAAALGKIATAEARAALFEHWGEPAADALLAAGRELVLRSDFAAARSTLDELVRRQPAAHIRRGAALDRKSVV